MPTTDEDLQKKKDEVQKLRDQLTAAEADADRKAREFDNDVAAAQLEAEAVRLQTELAAAKERGKAGNVKAGVSAPLDAARAAMKLAQDQAASAVALQEADAKEAERAKAVARGENPDDVAPTAVVAKSAATVDAPDAVRSN